MPDPLNEIHPKKRAFRLEDNPNSGEIVHIRKYMTGKFMAFPW